MLRNPLKPFSLPRREDARQYVPVCLVAPRAPRRRPVPRLFGVKPHRAYPLNERPLDLLED